MSTVIAFTLVWIVAAMTARGPVTGPIPEMTKFNSEAECVEFGNGMQQRVADYTRGMLKLDWSIPVSVAFQCQPSGQDS